MIAPRVSGQTPRKMALEEAPQMHVALQAQQAGRELETKGSAPRELLRELGNIVGGRDVAQNLLDAWRGVCAQLSMLLNDEFEPTRNLQALQRRLQAAAKHAKSLAELLDDQVAEWIVIGSSTDPRVESQAALAVHCSHTREEVAKLAGTLQRLVLNLEAAAAVVRVRRGRRVRLSPRNVATLWLINELIELGIENADGDGARMVRAVRLCWGTAGFEGDPRDFMRSVGG